MGALTLEQFIARGVDGRRFTCREGQTSLRGQVQAPLLADDKLTIPVTHVERRGRTDPAWMEAADFDYASAPHNVRIHEEADGTLFVAIGMIGEIRIAPARKEHAS